MGVYLTARTKYKWLIMPLEGGVTAVTEGVYSLFDEKKGRHSCPPSSSFLSCKSM